MGIFKKLMGIIDADFDPPQSQREHFSKNQQPSSWQYQYRETAHEREALNNIENYLRNAPLLQDFTIEREVSPALFDADQVIRKHYGNMGCNKYGEPYSANKYGRPASFVLRDSQGYRRLIIMAAKKSAHSHWLVAWCRLWCQDNHVPFLKLLLESPNNEQYVISRVCKELDL